MRDLLFHNFWSKLVSLILAALIWFGIRYTKNGIQLFQNTTRPLVKKTINDVPLLVRHRPDGESAVWTEPDVVDITVRARDRVLKQLTKQDILVYVDVYNGEGLNGGVRVIQYEAPVGVEVENVIPTEATIYFKSTENEERPTGSERQTNVNSEQ
ncbi:MAG: hypothetical protein K9N48_03675 [Verrucomicrobia bacterium]|nr:hypothetical protein [Verrucomicrobiota bacterium]MCF7708681.1 hypothetical protein [Verrucomicrobiota bacterium]